MELRLEQHLKLLSLRQTIFTLKFVTGSLVCSSLATQICLPSLASSSPPVETVYTRSPDITSPDITSLDITSLDIASPGIASLQKEQMSELPTIPSVAGLSDVKPTDWAYQTLKALMERYGVLAGYPDGRFRGNRAVNRYEYAAALAATLEKVENLIADVIGEEFIQRDMIVLRRLQREYRGALDELKNRIDISENRINEMEGNLFSTTTKLQAQGVYALTDGSNANVTVVNRTRLNFLTSFNKKDLLLLQLESGNNGGDAISNATSKNPNSLSNSGFINNTGGLDYAGVENNFKLRRLYYTFNPTSDLAVSVGTKMSPRDFIDRNRYANNEALDFSSSVFLNNPLIVQSQIDRQGGAGAAILWSPQGSKFSVRTLYIAGNANQPTNQLNSNNNNGLFGQPRQGSLEVEFVPTDKLKLKLQYTNAIASNTNINAVGVNAEYALNRGMGIFGRLGIGNYQGFNTAINRNIDTKPGSWSLGVGWRDLVIPGTFAGVAIGQPFISKDFGNATQTNLEAFYNLQLNENLSLTPTLSLIVNPNNNSANGTMWQSTLRSVFSF
jgi:Carbohydrate-selective porin, OprB family/S-layer homology domain